MEDLIILSEEQDIQVIFILPPRLGTRYQDMLPAFTQLPETNKMELADPQEFPSLYTLKNSYDVGHLNERGATIYTKNLARLFKRLLNQAVQQ